MAATDDIAIVRLGVEDAAAGLVLSTEARWNQNEADWRFFLSKGVVFGVRDDAGRLVATAALLPYSAGNAWISMVLVTESWRRRGIATRLVDSCLEHGEADGPDELARCDAGRRQGLWPARFCADAGIAPAAAGEFGIDRRAAQSLETCEPAAFIARDAHAMGFARDALLAEFAGRSGSRMVKKAGAMALVRDGRTARHIGPLFADSPDEALALVQAIVRSERGPLLLDAVHSQSKFLEGLTGSGWNIERPFQRMRFGSAATQAAEPPFAVAGPEFG